MFSASNVPHRNRNRLRNSSEDPGRVWLAKPLCASCGAFVQYVQYNPGIGNGKLQTTLCIVRVHLCNAYNTIRELAFANHFVHRAFVQCLQYNPGGMIGNQQTALKCMLVCIFIQRSGSSLTGKPLCAFPSLLCTKHMCAQLYTDVHFQVCCVSGWHDRLAPLLMLVGATMVVPPSTPEKLVSSKTTLMITTRRMALMITTTLMNLIITTRRRVVWVSFWGTQVKGSFRSMFSDDHCIFPIVAPFSIVRNYVTSTSQLEKKQSQIWCVETN